MRTFILGSLVASVVWVFLTLDGGSRLRQAWDSHRQNRVIATAHELAKERENAFAEHFRPIKECLAPSGELKKLECDNHKTMARRNFYAEWNRANAARLPQ